MMAEAARFNVERARKSSTSTWLSGEKGLQHPGGSALLKDEPLVGRILKAVVNAVNVPVTLKFRTGGIRSTRTL